MGASSLGSKDGVDVFISYARPDRSAAGKLYSALQRLDVRVYWDREALLPGDPWVIELPAALDASRLVVAIVSERPEAGPYHLREIARAVSGSGGKPVVPIYLPGRTPETTQSSFSVSDRVAIFFDEVGDWDAVAEQLHRALDRNGVVTPYTPPARRSGKPVAEIETLTDEVWRQVASTHEVPAVRERRPEARRLRGRSRKLQQELLERSVERLDDPAGGLPDPLVVRIGRKGVWAPVADPRFLMRLKGAPGRFALIGEVGSGRHEVVRLLLQTLMDAAFQAEKGSPHFAEGMADLLPVLLSIDDLPTAASEIEARLPTDVRRELDRGSIKIEQLWLVLLCTNPVAKNSETERRFHRLLEELFPSSCLHLLVVVHTSAREALTRGWTLVSLQGIHVEAVHDPDRRRWLRRCLEWSGAGHLPVGLVRKLKPNGAPDLGRLAGRLVHNALLQQEGETRAGLAAFLLDRTLPALLAWIHSKHGDLVTGAGDLVDLYRNRSDLFPELSRAEDVIPLLTRLPFLFRGLDGDVAVVPSLLAAYLAGKDGDGGSRTPADTLSPFELAVRAFRARHRGEGRPEEVPRLAWWALPPGEDHAPGDLMEAVRELDPKLRRPLMRSPLAGLSADLLRPVVTEEEVRELLREIEPIARSLWAFDEMTGVEPPSAAEATALLDLVEPGHAGVLLALAPNRVHRFLAAASRSLDRNLLERHLGELVRAHPERVPAVLVNRLSLTPNWKPT